MDFDDIHVADVVLQHFAFNVDAFLYNIDSVLSINNVYVIIMFVCSFPVVLFRTTRLLVRQTVQAPSR